MAKWLGVAIPATFINSLIRYLESNLALSLRSRLVEYAYKLYLSNETYYGVSNLDSRLANPDQCLTDDLEKFASAAAHLYSNISKPLLDVVLMLGALVHTAAKQTKREGIALQLVLGIGTAAATSGILRLVSPRFGKLVVEEAEKSGYLRYLHSRLVTNSEEIAFYGGNKVELSMLQRAYKALSNFKRIIFMKRLYYVFFEQFFMKYIWTGTGMVMIAIPIMTGHGHQTSDTVSGTISDRSQWYTTARSLMVSGADALERIMSSYKEVAEMAGYTSRVSNMFAVFEDVGSGHYRRAVVTQPSSGNSPQSEKERKKASTEEKETEEPGSGSDSYRF
jgi:ATP-binding cassette subfamily D (ALD) protein 2